MGGQKMSATTQLQEIITDNSIRSFNHGYTAGSRDTQSRTSAALQEILSDGYISVVNHDGSTIAITKADLIRRIEEVL
jgi:hypothetical protein